MEGHAISFATPDQGQDIRIIEKLIRKTIPMTQHPAMANQSFDSSSAPASRPSAHPRGRTSFGGANRGGGGNSRGAGKRAGSTSGGRNTNRPKTSASEPRPQTPARKPGGVIQVHGRAPSFK
jgi:hypothetical protein